MHPKSFAHTVCPNYLSRTSTACCLGRLLTSREGLVLYGSGCVPILYSKPQPLSSKSGRINTAVTRPGLADRLLGRLQGCSPSPEASLLKNLAFTVDQAFSPIEIRVILEAQNQTSEMSPITERNGGGKLSSSRPEPWPQSEN